MLRKEINIQPVSNYYDCMMHSRSNQKQNKTKTNKTKTIKEKKNVYWENSNEIAKYQEFQTQFNEKTAHMRMWSHHHPSVKFPSVVFKNKMHLQ